MAVTKCQYGCGEWLNTLEMEDHVTEAHRNGDPENTAFTVEQIEKFKRASPSRATEAERDEQWEQEQLAVKEPPNDAELYQAIEDWVVSIMRENATKEIGVVIRQGAIIKSDRSFTIEDVFKTINKISPDAIACMLRDGADVWIGYRAVHGSATERAL